MIIRPALVLLLTMAAAAAADRNVILSWAASTSARVVAITYNLLRCQVVSPAVGCLPSTVINPAPVTGTTYTDQTAVIGDTYVYGVEAVAPACGTVTGICGTSAVTRTAEPILIPQRPSAPSPTATVTITVTGHGIVAVVE